MSDHLPDLIPLTAPSPEAHERAKVLLNKMEQRMSEHLPDVQLTPEQEERALAIVGDGFDMYESEVKAARLIVHLQDRVAELEVDKRLDRVERELSETTPADAAKRAIEHYRKFGHGHVVARDDGIKARCGGPGLCKHCETERQATTAETTACQHDLLKPDTTVVVESQFAASCSVCKQQWNFARPAETTPATPEPTVEGALRELGERLGLPQEGKPT